MINPNVHPREVARLRKVAEAKVQAHGLESREENAQRVFSAKLSDGRLYELAFHLSIEFETAKAHAMRSCVMTQLCIDLGCGPVTSPTL